MGIKEAHDRIAKRMHEQFSFASSVESIKGYQFQEALEIIEQECPEVKSVENQTQFKRNSNATSDIYKNVLTVLNLLLIVDSYEIALEGLMNAESDDEEISDALADVQEESVTRKEFVESLHRLLYLFERNGGKE